MISYLMGIWFDLKQLQPFDLAIVLVAKYYFITWLDFIDQLIMWISKLET